MRPSPLLRDRVDARRTTAGRQARRRVVELDGSSAIWQLKPRARARQKIWSSCEAGHDCPDAKDNAPSLVRHGGRGGGRPAVEDCLLRVQGLRVRRQKEEG